MNYQGQEETGKNDQQYAFWRCPKCGNINSTNFCPACGTQRANVADKELPKKKKSFGFIKVILVLLVLGIGSKILVNAFVPCLSGHQWSEATCTEPKTCLVCGEAEGEALGHIYTEATCTKAKVCTRCGHQTGAPLSHNWMEATYDYPETCSRCGITQGNVKGYVAHLEGDWASKAVSVGGTDTTPWIFDEKVENCRQVTMHLRITDVDFGTPFGNWTLYAKNGSNKWKKLKTFKVPDQTEVVKTFEFDEPVTFTRLAAVGPSNASFSYSFNLWFEDWYLLED